MKILALTNRYYIVSIFVIAVIGSIVSFKILESIINREFNNKLYAERDQFIHEWHNYKDLRESLYLNIGDRIEVVPLDHDTKQEDILKDTVMFDSYENKVLNFRQLIFSDQLNGQFYKITVTKSLLPNEDMIEGIGEIMFILIGLLAVTLVLINRWIALKIWEPFYQSLSAMRKFNVTRPEPINVRHTNIDEFRELNDVLGKMTTKSQRDYFNLKEFTENASHEIQTPIAIIKSKAELLIQESNLRKDEIEDIKHIYDAANRLSRLKHGLSLLSKIENNQFQDSEPIGLKTFLENKIDNLTELVELKGITLTKRLKANPTLIINNDLAYILFTNLLNNAVKHNIEKGSISVNLREDELVIENTGEPLVSDPESLFERFKKDSPAKDSSGLGLALVKKICDQYSIKIRYTVNLNIHRFSLRF